MKFGILKTAIENKMISSFVKNELTENFKSFKTTILGNNKLKKLYYIYDKLNENLGVDSNTANVILEELSNEVRLLNLKESDFKEVKKWIGGDVTVNNYNEIDSYLFSSLNEIESKSVSKMKIVEGLQKSKKVVTENKIPISSILKIN